MEFIETKARKIQSGEPISDEKNSRISSDDLIVDDRIIMDCFWLRNITV